MIKHFLSLLIFTALISSCGNSGKTTENVADVNGVKVEFASLIGHPGDYIGKDIAVEGKVVHVCTHSGKKLFIVGENPDVRLFIQAGENMPKFPMDLLGSTVVVEGTLTKVGGPAVAEGTAQHENAPVADTCETATAMASQVALADVMMEYKTHIVK